MDPVPCSGFALLFKVDASNVANHDRPFPKLESTAIAAIIEDLSAASATVDALPSPAAGEGAEGSAGEAGAAAGAGGPGGGAAGDPEVDADAGGDGGRGERGGDGNGTLRAASSICDIVTHAHTPHPSPLWFFVSAPLTLYPSLRT